MRTRVMFALTVFFALAVVVDVEATWPQRGWGGGYYGGSAMYTTPSTPGYVFGGSMYPAEMYATGTVVERTGPFGLVRRRVIMATPTPMMPATVTTMTPMTPTPTTAVIPAAGTTTPTAPMPMTGVSTSGYIVPPQTTFVERTGPFGFTRRRMMMTTPAPIMPAAATTVTPMPASPCPTVTPAAGTTLPPATAAMPMPATGVTTSGYIVPPAGTVTVVPAQYSFSRPFFRRGSYYSSPMFMSNGTSMPGTVTAATYAVPQTTTGYYYPQYSTGRFFNWSGFGFGWR
jgi:hypothetical protein